MRPIPHSIPPSRSSGLASALLGILGAVSSFAAVTPSCIRAPQVTAVPAMASPDRISSPPRRSRPVQTGADCQPSPAQAFPRLLPPYRSTVMSHFLSGRHVSKRRPTSSCGTSTWSSNSARRPSPSLATWAATAHICLSITPTTSVSRRPRAPRKNPIRSTSLVLQPVRIAH